MWSGPIPFRLLAIAQDETRIDDVARLALARESVGFGLMLRDPEHRRSAVEQLAAHALSLDLPSNVTLITNSFSVPGFAYVHGTSAQLVRHVPHAEALERDGMIFTGYSVHTHDDVHRATDAGARYVMFSPVFPTASHPGYPAAGLEALRSVCASTSVPVFALGGITPERIPDVLAAGAYGVAGISLFAAGNYARLEEALRCLEKGGAEVKSKKSKGKK